MNPAVTRLAALVLPLAACATAPEATEVEASPRHVKVNGIDLRMRLPVGAVLEGDRGTSVRYQVPGRGGADVLLEVLSSPGDLAEQTDAAAKRSDADGKLPEIVRSESVDGGNRVTSVSGTNKLVRVLVTVPIPGQGKAISCYANVTRSQPIADVPGTRRALETVCESIVFGP